ncbi:MAG: ATP-binding cassette domain-containing protein, partial [Clostridiales bacterium]|nr:ATP-binding cassette domain-containing protein [Clostridiales bacterium]
MATVVREKFDNIIEIKNVTKVFDGITAVDNVSLSVRRGEFVTLLGPSGCGKTTLLRMIAGFEMPTSGTILLEKQDVTTVPPHLRPINTVFQKYALFPHLNVFKNIAFGLKLKKIPTGEVDKKGRPVFRKFTKDEIAEKVERVLKLVNLEAYGYRDITGLSGGQQQRVAIARAIVCEPKVLLLDEPLGALDLKMRKEMQSELAAMHKNIGITFIYVTHDQEEALTMSDKVVVMTDGAVQQYGTPKKIYDEPANAFVADFIGESNILSGVMKNDFLVEFCGTQFKCLDKGFEKDEKVDLVIRPEDIAISAKKGALEGEVVSTVFKGTYYEMEIVAGDYQFTVQNTTEYVAGSKVWLTVEPDGIHIMKKLKTVNAFDGEVTSETTVEFCGGEFEFENKDGLERGDEVRVSVPFDKVELTDDEDDGVIGANVTQTLYKGSYYQVQVYTDDDQDFLIDTVDEWDIGDRVGIKINPADITVTRKQPEAASESDADAAGENDIAQGEGDGV